MAAASLELGNLEAAQRRWVEAAFWYARLAREATHSPYVAQAYFNLARVQLSGGDIVQARKTYFRVLDQAPGHELALRACLQIGQLYLEDDDAKQAIVHLRRAQTIAARSPYHPLAAITLTAAYMHDGDLDSARRTLAQSRNAVQQEPYFPTALFLDRYLQYRLSRASKESLSAQRDTSELIGVLWRNKDESVLGAYGQWLIAKAYNDLDFSEPADRALRAALANARGPFKSSVEFHLADTLAKRDKHEEATQLFTKWANTESPYRARSQFQLARIALQEKRYTDCATQCRKLWVERSYPDQSAVLNLWGAALEGSGDLVKAAQCYAGKPPE